MLATLGVSKADRDPVGRWSPSGSDEYVRTYKNLMRGLVSKLWAALLAGDLARTFDEEDGIQEAALLAQRRQGGQREDYEQDGKLLLERSSRFYQDFSKCCAGWVATPPADVKLPEAPELQEAEGEDENSAKFILSVTSRGQVTRLHKAGGCWRATALSIKHYSLVHDKFVDESRYHLVCKDCFPQDRPQKDIEGGEKMVAAAESHDEGAAGGPPSTGDSASSSSDSASSSDDI